MNRVIVIDIERFETYSTDKDICKSIRVKMAQGRFWPIGYGGVTFLFSKLKFQEEEEHENH